MAINTDKDNDLKTRVRYSNSFDTELLKEVKQISKETMIPISKLFDYGMKCIIEKYRK